MEANTRNTVGNKRMNQALLAIELTGVPWDFGALAFENLVIKADTTQTAWCTVRISLFFSLCFSVWR